MEDNPMPPVDICLMRISIITGAFLAFTRTAEVFVVRFQSNTDIADNEHWRCDKLKLNVPATLDNMTVSVDFDAEWLIFCNETAVYRMSFKSGDGFTECTSIDESRIITVALNESDEYRYESISNARLFAVGRHDGSVTLLNIRSSTSPILWR